MLYRVKEGRTFGHSDQHAAGAIVELAPHEAAPFLDKLQPVFEQGAGEGAGESAVSLDTVSSDTASEQPPDEGQGKGRERRRRAAEPGA